MDKSVFISALLVWVIPIPLSALLLMAAARIIGVKEFSYRLSFKVIAIISLIGFCIGLVINTVMQTFSLSLQQSFILYFSIAFYFLMYVVLAIILIKQSGRLSLGKSLAVWIVWLIFHAMLIGFVITPIWAIVSFSMQFAV